MTNGRAKRVLLLDDERVITDIICIILRQYGYETRGAYRHSEAVAIAREFRPDILITGFNNLSEKNGCETALEILAFLPQCHVLISSGQFAAADALEYYRQHGKEFDVLVKPIHPRDLVAKLRSITN